MPPTNPHRSEEEGDRLRHCRAQAGTGYDKPQIPHVVTSWGNAERPAVKMIEEPISVGLLVRFGARLASVPPSPQ